jgi:cobalamin biosynthesis Mg chelatase CobN
MRFSTVAILFSAGLAAAQTTTGPSSPSSTDTCQAQNIVDACLNTIQSQIDACDPNDWICLCDQYTNKLTCWNNCPDSNERPPVQNQVTQYCNAAAPLKSSSLAAAATMPKPSNTPSATATTTGGAGSSNTASASISAASGFSTGGAVGSIVPPVGGAVALLFGFAGLL